MTETRMDPWHQAWVAFVCAALALGAGAAGAGPASTPAGALNVVAEGADPTGKVDCTELLTRLHATGNRVYYPNGTYRFNGPKLDLSGGVRFESPGGVVVRNDIAPGNILQFDDFGNLIGLQQNHLELNEAKLGGPLPIDAGSLVRPPLSRTVHRRRAHLLAHWYNDFGLEHRRHGAPNLGWIGWYYWSWNFHGAPGDGYDPARHPLLGFYRGDDPVVLDWQCYWLREYGVRGVILYLPSPPVAQASSALQGWDAPEHQNHWIRHLFTDVPNFGGLKYVMAAYTPWTKDAPAEDRAKVEQAWRNLIETTYFRHGNFYAVEKAGKSYPVLYLHEEEAVRGVFDNYRGAKNTAEFYRRIAALFRGRGCGGVALFARHAISDTLVDWPALEADGILHFTASYAEDYSKGATYAESVANYSPPAGPRLILNVCTAKHTHTPHPSKWVCPGHTPALFRAQLDKAVAHIERHGMPRILTCYNMAEWAEGGPALQPNMQDRFGYLEAVRDALVARPDGATP